MLSYVSFSPSILLRLTVMMDSFIQLSLILPNAHFYDLLHARAPSFNVWGTIEHIGNELVFNSNWRCSSFLINISNSSYVIKLNISISSAKLNKKSVFPTIYQKSLNLFCRICQKSHFFISLDVILNKKMCLFLYHNFFSCPINQHSLLFFSKAKYINRTYCSNGTHYAYYQQAHKITWHR